MTFGSVCVGSIKGLVSEKRLVVIGLVTAKPTQTHRNCVFQRGLHRPMAEVECIGIKLNDFCIIRGG